MQLSLQTHCLSPPAGKRLSPSQSPWVRQLLLLLLLLRWQGWVQGDSRGEPQAAFLDFHLTWPRHTQPGLRAGGWKFSRILGYRSQDRSQITGHKAGLARGCHPSLTGPNCIQGPH